MKKLPCRFAKYFGTKQALCLRPAGRSVSASETSRTVTQQGRRDSPLAPLLAARSRTDGRDRPFPPASDAPIPIPPRVPSRSRTRGGGSRRAGRRQSPHPTQPNGPEERAQPKQSRPTGRPATQPSQRRGPSVPGPDSHAAPSRAEPVSLSDRPADPATKPYPPRRAAA